MASSSSPRITRPRRWIVAGLVAVILLAVIVLVFEPHTLFIDTRVDDAFPASATAAGSGPAPTPPSASAAEAPATEAPGEQAPATDEPADAPVALATGAFVDRDHPTSGTATVFALADGTRVLRFDDLATDNGPDLKVYLSAAAADAPPGEFDEVFVDLGPLAGNLGNQNYAIPPDVDLDQYASVVIWCDRFDVPFGASPLT